jgi:hypothetical protein
MLLFVLPLFFQTWSCTCIEGFNKIQSSISFTLYGEYNCRDYSCNITSFLWFPFLYKTLHMFQGLLNSIIYGDSSNSTFERQTANLVVGSSRKTKLLDLRLSRQWLWRILSSRMWLFSLLLLVLSGLLYRPMAEPSFLCMASSVCCLCLAGCLLDVLFDPEDVGSTFLWNAGELLPYYTASHPRR